VELSVLDRIAIINSLPAQGNFITLSLANDLRLLVSIGTAEIEDINLRFGDGERMEWDASRDVPRDYVISDSMRDLVSSRLRELDRKGELTVDHIGIYRKFVLSEE